MLFKGKKYKWLDSLHSFWHNLLISLFFFFLFFFFKRTFYERLFLCYLRLKDRHKQIEKKYVPKLFTSKFQIILNTNRRKIIKILHEFKTSTTECTRYCINMYSRCFYALEMNIHLIFLGNFIITVVNSV